MSLIFKPKIPESMGFIESAKVKTCRPNEPTKNHWTNEEVARLVQLRAHGVSFKDCAKLLHRGTPACVTMIVGRDLYGEIDRQRHQLIEGILA